MSFKCHTSGFDPRFKKLESPCMSIIKRNTRRNPQSGIHEIFACRNFSLALGTGVDWKTVAFFLKISKEIGKTWRKSLTRASVTRRERLSPVSLSVFSLIPVLLFDCSRVLECAKIRTVLQSSTEADLAFYIAKGVRWLPVLPRMSRYVSSFLFWLCEYLNTPMKLIIYRLHKNEKLCWYEMKS